LAHDLGVSYFDTAPSYGAGIAEHELGRFLRDKRSRVVLTTKFGIPTGRLGSMIPGWNYAAMAGRLAKRLVASHRSSAQLPRRDFSAGRAKSSLEDSLRALRTDYIDVLYLHEPALELLTDADGLANTLEELKAAGKVRYIGLAGHAAACTGIARRHPRLAQVLQIEVAADSEGLPNKASADIAAVAVTFWEFAAGPVPAERLRTTVERVLAAAPHGVTLLSTNCGASLREAVAICEQM
jgi:aryl-alcohol dehydrogenase-like predicted oxidoreductase